MTLSARLDQPSLRACKVLRPEQSPRKMASLYDTAVFLSLVLKNFTIVSCYAKKASCTVLRALSLCFLSITNDMLRSLEPWAIERMLIPASPSALNILPAIPGVPTMLSPITEIISRSSRITNFSIRFDLSSVLNSRFSVSSARSA